MKGMHVLLTAGLLAASLSAGAQTGSFGKTDPGLGTPSDPGMPGPRSPGGAKAPKQSGMVVVPPPVSDREAIITPPKNVDPGMKSSPDDRPGDKAGKPPEKFK